MTLYRANPYLELHMKKSTVLTSLALGSLVTLSGCANGNPFSAEPMKDGYQNTSKVKEASCAGHMNKKAEGSCAGHATDMDKKADGKCGEGKCGADGKKMDKKADGSCAGHASAMDKKADGKCGEGKCGATK